ncbi:TetR/AcrR family transcriptional regulator [Rhodococcus sp. O3]|uniref:TetR/AcrR family transcriptional regulator n=1 Tax=Rhodococcus sp. O3 TaxID=3404919 RepID=UPI003B676A2E
MDDVTELGLRDRKKAATRAALGAAAARLARARGIEAVTADAIAAEAGVSTRTFHNYFASKEEAVLEHLDALLQNWLQRLRDRPSDEHVWDAIEAAALEVVAEIDDFDELCAMFELVEQSPALVSRSIEMQTRTAPLLVETIAERSGRHAGTDIYPALLNYCAVAAIRASIDLWVAGTSGAQSPEELIRAAFDRLRQGIS